MLQGLWCAEIGDVNLVHRFAEHPIDRPAVIVGRRTVSYGPLLGSVARWRGGLVAAGVGAGDRVVIVCGNDQQFVLAHLAVMGVGAVSVPLNPRCPAPELARELSVIDASVAIIGEGADQTWNEIDAAKKPPTIPLDVLDAAEPAPIAEVDADDAAVLLFTSGTAGSPRPAILTHGNFDASLRSLLSLPVELASVHHTGLAVIPLFHIFGLNVMLHLGLAIGATLVLEEFSTVERMTQIVEEHAVTIIGGPPTLWWELAQASDATAESYSSVALAISGAAKLPPSTATSLQDRLGLAVAEGYGLTETCATVASSVGTAAPVGSVGALLPGVEGRLVDTNGDDVLVSDPGELWVRGPMVSPGYYNDDQPNRGRSNDGWLRTGDMAVVDDDGHLAIVDRLTDVIIVSGFNVFPGEVEAVMRAHPMVADVGVIGEPHEAMGELIVAYVVAEVGDDIEPVELSEQLQEYCRAHLARYKVPRRIELRDALPHGVIGKLRRRELR